MWHVGLGLCVVGLQGEVCICTLRTCINKFFDYHKHLIVSEPEEKEMSGEVTYINSLWDMALQASQAIIEGVDWVQICTCSISY